MIIDFSLSPVWKAIGEISGGTISLDGYWTSAETKTYVDSAVSGIDLSNYYTKSETDSAITAVEDHLFDVEEVTASALTELHNAVLELSGSSVDLSGYYTSGETDAAISAATAGKADAANVSGNTSNRYFPLWNKQGIITGTTGLNVWAGVQTINGVSKLVYGGQSDLGAIYAPTDAGTAGKVLVSKGSGAPVWSAITMPDMSDYTPTSGFSTINGSAITNGGNIVIQGGGGDMSQYWTSAQTKAYVDSADTALQDQIDTMDDVVSAALVDLNDTKVGSTNIRHMLKLSQAEYDAATQSGATADPATLYIIVNNS